MRPLVFLRVAAALWLLLAAASCGSRKESDTRPVIAVSFESQKEIVERIAGDEYRVVALLPPGSDPEMFDPDMRVMKALEKAEIYLTTSTLGFEQQVGERIRANYPSLKVTDLTTGIDILMHTHELASASGAPGGHSGCMEDADGHDHGHDHGREERHGASSHQVGDPHLMSSLRNAETVARNVAEALSALNPANAAEYYARCSALAAELHRDDLLTDSLLTASGAKGGMIVVMHPSLSYYARDYGILQLPLETDGKEATPRQLEQRLRLAADGHPLALFYEAGHSERQAREIARSLGTQAYPVMLNGSDFIGRINDVTHAIAKGATQQAAAGKSLPAASATSNQDK